MWPSDAIKWHRTACIYKQHHIEPCYNRTWMYLILGIHWLHLISNAGWCLLLWKPIIHFQALDADFACYMDTLPATKHPLTLSIMQGRELLFTLKRILTGGKVHTLSILNIMINCPTWACPWAQNLSNLVLVGSRCCGMHLWNRSWIFSLQSSMKLTKLSWPVVLHHHSHLPTMCLSMPIDLNLNCSGSV